MPRRKHSFEGILPPVRVHSDLLSDAHTLATLLDKPVATVMRDLLQVAVPRELKRLLARTRTNAVDSAQSVEGGE